MIPTRWIDSSLQRLQNRPDAIAFVILIPPAPSLVNHFPNSLYSNLLQSWFPKNKYFNQISRLSLQHQRPSPSFPPSSYSWPELVNSSESSNTLGESHDLRFELWHKAPHRLGKLPREEAGSIGWTRARRRLHSRSMMIWLSREECCTRSGRNGGDRYWTWIQPFRCNRCVWNDRTRRKVLMKKRVLDASSSGGDVGSFVGRDG